jgi:hypothetical protein
LWLKVALDYRTQAKLATNEKGLALLGIWKTSSWELLLGFVLLLMFTTSAWLYSSSPNQS